MANHPEVDQISEKLTSVRSKTKFNDLEHRIKLRQGNISLILDSYDDIFSDFDPRPFQERTLSADFLFECKRAVIDRIEDSDSFELRLMVPKEFRNPKSEKEITERLLQHFHRHHRLVKEERRRIQKMGWKWVAVGISFIFLAVVTLDKEDILSKLLVVIFEPAGWFSIWTGFEKVFSPVLDKEENYDFYNKTGNIKVTFISY